jgi:mannose-1-phosphate guanylyltransferase
MARDPEAVVAVMPSDHFIHSGQRFQAILDEAFRLAEFLPGQIVLLAAAPDGPEGDYGWIAPGKSITEGGAFLAGGFKEKPKNEDAQDYFRRGWLWNTMIIVARASALWNHAQDLRPEMMTRFQALRGWIGLPDEQEAIELAYRGMPSVNLSRDLLEPLADWTVALPMTGVHWSDWGRPERVEQTLIRIGRKSALPAALPVGAGLVPVAA